MHEDSLVREIVKLKQQLEEEKTKVKSIDTFLEKARNISRDSNSNDQVSSTQNLLEKQIKEHQVTKQQYEEELKKKEEDKQTIDKLQKRIRDLMKAHANTLEQLEEQRITTNRSKEMLIALNRQLNEVEKKELQKSISTKEKEKDKSKKPEPKSAVKVPKEKEKESKSSPKPSTKKEDPKVPETSTKTPTTVRKEEPKIETPKKIENSNEKSNSTNDYDISNEIEKNIQSTSDGLRSWRLRLKNVPNYSNITDLQQRYKSPEEEFENNTPTGTPRKGSVPSSMVSSPSSSNSIDIERKRTTSVSSKSNSPLISPRDFKEENNVIDESLPSPRKRNFTWTKPTNNIDSKFNTSK
jgi:hypothetical protein